MTWLVVLAIGAGSYLFRVGPLLLLRRGGLSDHSDRLIRHAGTAAITALIVVSATGAAAAGMAVPTIVAMAVGTVLAARGASMVQLLVVGGSLYAAAAVTVGLLTA